MAQFTLKIPTRTSVAATFTPTTDIIINSVRNYGNLPINFKEGNTIPLGTTLEAEGSAGQPLEIINVVVDYTEI